MRVAALIVMGVLAMEIAMVWVVFLANQVAV